MKNKNIIFFTATLFALAFNACKKDNVAPPLPVEDLTTITGRYRAVVSFPVPAGAVKGRVFYNSGSFKEFEVTDAQQSVLIEDLSEAEHTLRVVTFNAEGTVSDPRAVKVKVYGSNYEETLRPRRWQDQVTHSPTSIELFFENAFTGEVDVKLFFTNTSGAKDSLLMPASQKSITINNIDTEEPYYFYSRYKPEPNALDYFSSPEVDAKNAILFDFKKVNWQVVGMPDEVAGREAALAIDNVISTSWQSSSIVQAGSQHSLTVDMNIPKVIGGFSLLTPYTNDKTAKRVRIEISNDNINWTRVVDMDLKLTFLAQQYTLPTPVSAQYFKITSLNLYDEHTTGMVFAEIDLFNSQGSSGDNGHKTYTNKTTIPMVNANNPFQGDGSNPFPPLGDYRLQKLSGWTHSANAVASFDNTQFSLFTAAVWGLPEVHNGKVYQTLNLQSGTYSLTIDVSHADGPVDIYTVAATGTTLPDIADVKTSSSALRYVDLIPHQQKKVEMAFNVPTAGNVSIGVVYNITSQYATTNKPWSTFTIKGFELEKVVL